MIISICVARSGSQGFPGKHEYMVNGKSLIAWPLLAATSCRLVDETFLLTDSDSLKNIAKYYGINVIDEPEELAASDADTGEAYVYAYYKIISSPVYYKNINKELEAPEFVVLLMGNAVGINSAMMTEMITKLRANEKADSICTISEYNMFSPQRMRRKSGEHIVNYERVIEVDCHRNSGGDYYIYDCSCAVVRPRCLENLSDGMLPQRWLGNTVLFYEQEIPITDIDFRWQIPQASYWLSKNGVS